MIKRICQHCGKEFYVYPSYIKVGGGKFCSKECWYKYKHNKVKRICEQCGKEFEARPSVVKMGNGKFCSRKCMGASKSGMNHKDWKGNEVGYATLHDWVRQNKPKPKPNACEICGKVTTKLDAANISGEYKRDLNDFIYLCKKCHTGKGGFDVTKRKNPHIKPITILNQLKSKEEKICQQQ